MTFDLYGESDRGNCVAVCSDGTAEDVVAEVTRRRGSRWQHNPHAVFNDFFRPNDTFSSPQPCSDDRPGHQHYFVLRAGHSQFDRGATAAGADRAAFAERSGARA